MWRLFGNRAGNRSGQHHVDGVKFSWVSTFFRLRLTSLAHRHGSPFLIVFFHIFIVDPRVNTVKVPFNSTRRTQKYKEIEVLIFHECVDKSENGKNKILEQRDWRREREKTRWIMELRFDTTPTTVITLSLGIRLVFALTRTRKRTRKGQLELTRSNVLPFEREVCGF